MDSSALIQKLVSDVIDPGLLVLFATGLFLFMWGLFQFMRKMGDDSKQYEDGRRHMIWGVVGMTVMVSVYGIINIIGNTVGIDVNNPNTTIDTNIPSMQFVTP